MKKLLIVLIFCGLNIFGQGILKVKTDKEVYSYGETIFVTTSLHNDTDSLITIWGSSSCPVSMNLDDIKFWTTCTADTHPLDIEPGFTREWRWILEPKMLSVPNFSGEHIIRSFCEDRIDSSSFEAPKFLGGIVNVGLDSNYNAEEINKLKDTLNVKVNQVSNYGSSISEEWEITGFDLDSLAQIFKNDTRLNYFSIHRPLQIESTNYVIVTSINEVPEKITLYQNYPNPFNPATTINYEINKTFPVSIKIYNVIGEMVKSLVDFEHTPGKYEVRFDASQLPSGIYIYKLVAGKKSISKKMILLK